MRVYLMTLVVGELLSSGAPVTSSVPLEDDSGRVRSCKVEAGYVLHCDATYSGTVVLPRSGKYVECEAQAGYVVRCKATGYSGKASLKENFHG